MVDLNHEVYDMCEHYVLVDRMLNTNDFEHLEYVVELHLVNNVPFYAFLLVLWCVVLFKAKVDHQDLAEVVHDCVDVDVQHYQWQTKIARIFVLPGLERKEL